MNREAVRLDLNTIVQALLIVALTWFGNIVWKTSSIVERLDERTITHERRLAVLESERKLAGYVTE